MEDLEKKIEEALRAGLPGVDVRFDPYPGYGKLHATIVWGEFEEQPLMDRHRQVRNILRSALTDDERYHTGFLLTLTPTEISAMQEEAVAA